MRLIAINRLTALQTTVFLFAYRLFFKLFCKLGSCISCAEFNSILVLHAEHIQSLLSESDPKQGDLGLFPRLSWVCDIMEVK